MSPCTFRVIGLPAPQGSKKHVGNGIMVESSKALKPWRSAVSAAAAEALERSDVEVFTGPLHLSVTFRLPMPKSRPAAVRAAGVAWKQGAPDLDKLVRSVGDAMTQAGLIGDDALIARTWSSKVEVWQAWTGALVTVARLGPPPPDLT